MNFFPPDNFLNIYKKWRCFIYWKDSWFILVKKCPYCGENIDSNLVVCNICCKSINSNASYPKTKYHLLSLLSLILGSIAFGIFWWFPVAFLNFAYEIFSRNVVVSLLSIYLFFSLLGLVLGFLSIKKGKKLYSILGVSFNFLVLIIISLELVFYFTAFLS